MLAQPLPDGRVPVLLSAHDETLITQDAWAILGYLDRIAPDHDPTAEVASTLIRLRRVRRHRAVVRAANRSELVDGLSALAHDEEHPLVARSSKSVAPSAAFVFPGQGNQWQSMGADAYRRLPAYRAEADRCAEAFVAAGLSSPLPYLQGDEDQNMVTDPDPGSAIRPRGQLGVAVAILRSASRYHHRTQPRRDRGGLCGREDLVIRCGRTGRCARSGRRPADGPLWHGSARYRGRRGARADRRNTRLARGIRGQRTVGHRGVGGPRRRDRRNGAGSAARACSRTGSPWTIQAIPARCGRCAPN